MRFSTHVVFVVLAAMSGLTARPAAAAEGKELATSQNAILCLDADGLGKAHAAQNSTSQDRLRELGCLRSPAGVPATLLGAADETGVWSVRFRPEGISDGITLWGRPSAFTLPDGTPLPTRHAAR